MLREPQSRRDMYQTADRVFGYPLYVAMEIVWGLLIIAVIIADLILRSASLYWSLTGLLIVVTISHSTEMTREHPRLLLKSSIWGAAAFAMGGFANYFIAAPYFPVTLAAIVSTAHYAWTGEIWTYERFRRQLLKAHGLAELEKRKQAPPLNG
jgi:hypothetical protein